VSVDGRLFAGLPARRVPLNELRDRLLRRRCPQTLRDAAWAHLVLLARAEGGAWTVGAVGVALPALTSIAATLSARFAGDPSDIHAAVLAGFVAELGQIDLRRPRIMLRLRWAAYRAGHAAVREALDAPAPSGHGFRSAVPPSPWGHPDFVLARAVAERAITAAEAELIGATRLEGVSLADAAAARDMSYQAARKARQRAEHRLVAYLLGDIANTSDTSHAGLHEGDVATRVADAVTITAAGHSAEPVERSRSVTDLAPRLAKKVTDRVSPQGRFSGVQGCGRRPATPAHTTSSPTPHSESTQHSAKRLSGTTPGVSRCA
jgi:hypothetical protein